MTFRICFVIFKKTIINNYQENVIRERTSTESTSNGNASIYTLPNS